MRSLGLALAFILLRGFAPAQQQGKLPSIPEIFASGGVTGRAPETVKWSPDGTRVSYVLRDDSGDTGQLYYIDVTTAKPAVLVRGLSWSGAPAPAVALLRAPEEDLFR